MGAKIAKGTRNSLAWVVGAFRLHVAEGDCDRGDGVLAVSIFVKADYNVEGSFTFEASEKQIVSTPFDRFFETVNVQIGDPVWTKKTAATFDELEGVESLGADADSSAGDGGGGAGDGETGKQPGEGEGGCGEPSAAGAEFRSAKGKIGERDDELAKREGGGCAGGVVQVADRWCGGGDAD